MADVNYETCIEAVRAFFETCPYLAEDYQINVDYLGDIKGYSIDTLPGDPVYKRYVDGRDVLQYEYTFTSKESYDGDARTTIANAGFYERVVSWVREQSMKRNFPVISGHKVQRNEVTSTGYLFTVDTDLARYQAQFRLVFL